MQLPATIYSNKWLDSNFQSYYFLKYVCIKPKNNVNPFQFSWATSDLIFSLFKAGQYFATINDNKENV